MVLNDDLPDTLTLHTYFNSLNSRLGDLGHLGLGDGRLVLIQWVQLEKKQEYIFNHTWNVLFTKDNEIHACMTQKFIYHESSIFKISYWDTILDSIQLLRFWCHDHNQRNCSSLLGKQGLRDLVWWCSEVTVHPDRTRGRTEVSAQTAPLFSVSLA